MTRSFIWSGNETDSELTTIRKPVTIIQVRPSFSSRLNRRGGLARGREHDAGAGLERRPRHRDAYYVEVSDRARGTGLALSNAAFAAKTPPSSVYVNITRGTWTRFMAQYTGFENDGDMTRVEYNTSQEWEAGPLSLSAAEARESHMSIADCCDPSAIYRQYLCHRLTRCVRTLQPVLSTRVGHDPVPQVALFALKFWHGAGGGAVSGHKDIVGPFRLPTAHKASSLTLEDVIKSAADSERAWFPHVAEHYGCIHTRNAAWCAGVPQTIADRLVPYLFNGPNRRSP